MHLHGELGLSLVFYLEPTVCFQGTILGPLMADVFISLFFYWVGPSNFREVVTSVSLLHNNKSLEYICINCCVFFFSFFFFFFFFANPVTLYALLLPCNIIIMMLMLFVTSVVWCCIHVVCQVWSADVKCNDVCECSASSVKCRCEVQWCV